MDRGGDIIALLSNSLRNTMVVLVDFATDRLGVLTKAMAAASVYARQPSVTRSTTTRVFVSGVTAP